MAQKLDQERTFLRSCKSPFHPLAAAPITATLQQRMSPFPFSIHLHPLYVNPISILVPRILISNYLWTPPFLTVSSTQTASIVPWEFISNIRKTHLVSSSAFSMENSFSYPNLALPLTPHQQHCFPCRIFPSYNHIIQAILLQMEWVSS